MKTKKILIYTLNLESQFIPGVLGGVLMVRTLPIS